MLSPFVAYIARGILDVDFKRLYTVIAYLGVFLVVLFTNKKTIKFPTYLFFYLLFIVYQFYSDFYILDREFKTIYLFSNTLIPAFLTMFIIENVPISKKDYSILFKIGKVTLIIAVVVILIQQTYDSTFFATETFFDDKKGLSDNQKRLYSIYSWLSPIAVGFSFVPIFLIVVEDLNMKFKKKQVLIWVLAGIMFSILTKARWIMVNTLLVFFLIAAIEKWRLRRLLKYIVIFPVIIISSYFILDSAGVNIKGIVEERIFESDKKNLNQKTASTRLLAFSIFNKLYWKNAIYGVGDVKYGMGGDGLRHNYELQRALGGHSSQIHVGYLSLFYRFGLIGGILFLGFGFFLIKKIYFQAKKNNHWAAFYGILGFFVANLTLVNFSFFELGVLFALLTSKYLTTQKEVFSKLNAEKL